MSKEFLFIGNRLCVYECMLGLGLDIVRTYAPQDSYLGRELDARGIEYQPLPPKKQLIEEISSTDFDVLVSNGCPYILPISKLQTGSQIFVNVHPSLLPDLKGITPINGAILYGREAGATCHLMDDTIDTGAPIAYVPIGNVKDITLGLLYKLSFEAEGEAFTQAYLREFKPLEEPLQIDNPIYYSRKESDLEINFESGEEQLVRQIRAFGTSSQGAYFVFKGIRYRVLDARIIKNEYLKRLNDGKSDGEVVYTYDNIILVKVNGAFVELRNIQGDISAITEGEFLYEK